MLPLHALRGSRAAIAWIRHNWLLASCPIIWQMIDQCLHIWPTIIVNIPCQSNAAQIARPNGTEFLHANPFSQSPGKIHCSWLCHFHSYQTIGMPSYKVRPVYTIDLQKLEIQQMILNHLCLCQQCFLLTLPNPIE